MEILNKFKIHKPFRKLRKKFKFVNNFKLKIFLN